ncbi:MAG: hypothetical protein DRJ26_03595 [Candidatus Methanomethylicota archaeon]|uniref:Uncharacterized protein n=1 Tax=Thermoproteota archaeon TaxID=2056631 RepID=A0A497F0W9_9CREN|nr:MAG: hypothetical protein DRJ26_03595 [Candidatus Verstraetearchaeota archaeon]
MINPRFISIIKNIKGVIYTSLSDAPLKELKWLSKSFRYRFLGITPSMQARPEILEIINKKPFIKLYYPTRAIQKMVNILSESSKIDKSVIEAVALASAYVTPLISFPKSSGDLEPLITLKVLSKNKLPEKEIKRHLRISGYTILDFHEKVTTEAYATILEACKKATLREALEKLINKREKLAEKDSKRYWRIISKEGEAVILYLDLISCLRNVKEEEIIDVVCDESVSLIFGITPCFILKVE